MQNQKSTKRAFGCSVVAVAICVAMLIGTTFAWFTSTASTNVNKIESGKLAVGLEVKKADGSWENAEGKTLNFVKGTNAPENEAVLWEPGCTYTLPAIRVINNESNSNLALKYKLVISGATGDVDLLNAIQFTAKIGEDEQPFANGSTLLQDKVLKPGQNSGEITLSGHMKEEAGNTYQGKTVSGIAVTVYATQAAVEYDSNGNTYDENAEYPVYPAGVTDESFETAVGTYKDSLGREQTAEAVAAYVDGSGKVQYVADLRTAALAGATTVYCKKDADMKARKIDTNRTEALTGDLTVYGNGADFNGGQISIMQTAAAPQIVNVRVENAKGLSVWGSPAKNGRTYNVVLKNCSLTKDSGEGLLMWRGDHDGTDKINLTIENCYLKSVGTQEMAGVHTTASGTITVKNSTFVDVDCPININFKQSGTLSATVENCTFVNCGKVKPEDDYFAPVRFVNNGGANALTATIANNTFTKTVGTNGDILLGDYRDGKTSNAFTATITTPKPVLVKSNATAPYSFEGGTVTVAAR